MADVVHPYYPPARILETVAFVFGVPVDKIRSGRIERLACVARHAAIILLEEFTPLSQSEMAVALGRKHCSSGRELRLAARRALEQDPRFGKTLEQARQRLTEELHA
jgi:chromosomal replication initiation ATPase DnaA